MKSVLRLSLPFLLALHHHSFALPGNFVYLTNIDASILQEIRYTTANNFVGRPIKGYQSNQCVLTLDAALALKQIQSTLRKQSLSLKVFDCYRPQQAVDDFITWSRAASDQKMKVWFYPNIDKRNLFKLNYLAMRSGHSRGSTVDVTIVKLDSKGKGTELAMGTHFDFLDPRSHSLTKNIAAEAFQHRKLLRDVMLKNGFAPLKTEWWHFTLRNEPYAHTYFNFIVGKAD